MAQEPWGTQARGWGDAFVLAQRPSGVIAESVPRAFANLDTNVALTSGRLHMFAIPLQSGTVVTSITFVSVGAATSPTQQLAGLYDSSRNQLRVSSNKTTTAWGANATSTFTLTSTYTTLYTGLFYIGIMQVATTPNTLAAFTQPSGVVGLAPILSGSSNTGLTTSLPNPANALSAIANQPYAYVS